MARKKQIDINKISTHFNALGSSLDNIPEEQVTFETQITQENLEVRKRTWTKPIATPEEKEQREQNLETRGKKGCQLPRINLAFSPANYAFVHRMAAYHGTTMTKYINAVITNYRERMEKENPEFFNTNLKPISELNFDDAIDSEQK